MLQGISAKTLLEIIYSIKNRMDKKASDLRVEEILHYYDLEKTINIIESILNDFEMNITERGNKTIIKYYDEKGNEIHSNNQEIFESISP